jgi:threonine/homoserine/homoserine lactone efflux protein
MVRAYLSTVLVALSNPLTVFPILALVTAAAAATATQVNAAVLIAGMLTGSSSWYGALVTGACLMRGGAGSALLGRLNRVFGLVLIAAGLSLLVRHLPAAA